MRHCLCNSSGCNSCTAAAFAGSRSCQLSNPSSRNRALLRGTKETSPAPKFSPPLIASRFIYRAGLYRPGWIASLHRCLLMYPGTYPREIHGTPVQPMEMWQHWLMQSWCSLACESVHATIAVACALLCGAHAVRGERMLEYLVLLFLQGIVCHPLPGTLPPLWFLTS